MTKNKYTDVCLKIIEAANMKIPLAFQTRLKTDRQATADKPGRQTLKFCIWGKSKNGFWNRHYSSYHIVYDSNQEASSKRGASSQIYVLFESRRN